MKNLRTKQIVEILNRDNVVMVTDLAEHFHVSIETIRRDLNYLEQQGLIKKVYGGAELKRNPATSNSSFLARQMYMTKTKTALGERVAGYIPDNSVVALDSGTTILECVQHFEKKENMCFICSDIHSANQLLSYENSNVYMLGGKLTTYGTSSSEFSNEFIESISKIDVLLLSADGVDPDSGLSNNEININLLKQKLMKKARQIVAVIDHSKFTRYGFYKMCDFSDLDVLVTDSGVPTDIINNIREHGVTVDIVDCPRAELPE